MTKNQKSYTPQFKQQIVRTMRVNASQSDSVSDKKYLFGILGFVVILAVFWIWIGRLADSELEKSFVITAFSVGKADALLLQQGDTAILVDTGEEDDGTYLLGELEKRGIDHLELLLITHFDKDHVGSAALIVQNLEVDTVLMPDYEGDRPEYTAFLECLREHPGVRRLSETVQFTKGSLKWTVYPAEDAELIQDAEDEYDNDMSLVASVSYGSRKFLLTGDIEKTRIGQMLDTDTDWHHDWIKMPHHGRYQKVLNALMDAVNPSWAVICCSNKNPAEEETLKMLEERQISVWDTADQSVVTVCDGENITIKYE